MAAVEVAAAVIARGRSVLACRRRADQPHPDKWEFPGRRSLRTRCARWMRGSCGRMRVRRRGYPPVDRAAARRGRRVAGRAGRSPGSSRRAAGAGTFATSGAAQAGRVHWRVRRAGWMLLGESRLAVVLVTWHRGFLVK